MSDLSDTVVTINAEFIHKTERAVRVRLGESLPPFFIWIPMSQIYDLYDSFTNQIDYNDLIKNEDYTLNISGWIALKLFDVESIEELGELELEYITIRSVG